VYVIELILDLYKSNLINIEKYIILLEKVKELYGDKDLKIMDALNQNFEKITILDYMWNKKFLNRKIEIDRNNS
jgi:hypothetical protein